MAEKYIETPVGSLALYKFVKLTEVNPDFTELPKSDISDELSNYILEVHMDDYIALSIPSSQDQLHHVVNAIMTGINDVFPLNKDYKEDVISIKNILKKEVAWANIKNVLGFEFDGNPGEYNIWLTEYRHTNILTKLKN